ncbi:MAG TPA: BTAD domain-containing putative transcriptional regulator [Actinomycetes bacterium]|jgi:predicted ATPase/DNA-binding SARP family transcriptional activator|nr:BTAD domain-containing putative transcriptional regulator [Actinomycetes bacterium]
MLEIRLLGPLEVIARGCPVEVTGSKRRALVALLALRPGRVVAVDALAEVLWGPELPAAPRNAVQHHVARLRAALGPEVIAAVPDGYALKDATVDTLRFQERLAAARSALRQGDPRAAAEIVAQALSLWRGPALQGLPDLHWVSAEAGRLEALRADALEERFEAALALGEHAEIIVAIRARLEEHPFRERLWAQLMLALYRCGRQADALETYQEARRVLSEQLGIEPGPDLQRLQAAILAHDPAIGAAAVPRGRRGNLPAPMTSFVGRQEALAQVVGLLREQRLVTLTGPPGVGKSRLGLEAVRSIENEVPDGVWLADLTRAGRAADAPRVVARAIDARTPTSDRDPLARVIARLRDADALLVLDGCGRMVDEAARLAAAVLAECPGVRVLATSREVLHLPGEARVNIAPLTLPPTQAPDSGGSEAVQLFAERARAARPGFELTPEAAGLAAAICRRLDGLPLAIELAAARVNVLGLREILSALDHRFALLRERDRPALERPASLETLVAWSYDLLHADEKALLHQLATFRGGAPLAAVVATAAHHGLDKATLTHLLGTLADKSIIAPSFPDGEPRYDLLDTVREYVLERLRESGGLHAAQLAHAEYFARLAEGASAGVRGRDHRAWTGRLERERDNLWAALTYARDLPEPQIALRLGVGLGWYFVLAHRVSEGRSFLDLALAATPADAPGGRRIALHAHLALLAMGEFDLPAALEAGERALALAATVDAAEETALAQTALVQPLAASGERERAAALVAEARATYDSLDDEWGVAACDVIAAIAALRTGDVDAVATLAAQIVPRIAALGYEWYQAWGMLLEAWVAQRRGKRAAAAGAYRRALELATSTGLATHASFALAGLGSIALADGKARDAGELQRRAIATAEAAQAPWFAAHARVQLARSLAATGDLEAAATLYQAVVEWSEREAPQQARELPFAALAGSPGAAALLGLAELAAARGDEADGLRARASARAEQELDQALVERARGTAATR